MPDANSPNTSNQELKSKILESVLAETSPLRTIHKILHLLTPPNPPSEQAISNFIQGQLGNDELLVWYFLFTTALDSTSSSPQQVMVQTLDCWQKAHPTKNSIDQDIIPKIIAILCNPVFSPQSLNEIIENNHFIPVTILNRPYCSTDLPSPGLRQILLYPINSEEKTVWCCAFSAPIFRLVFAVNNMKVSDMATEPSPNDDHHTLRQAAITQAQQLLRQHLNRKILFHDLYTLIISLSGTQAQCIKNLEKLCEDWICPEASYCEQQANKLLYNILSNMRNWQEPTLPVNCCTCIAINKQLPNNNPFLELEAMLQLATQLGQVIDPLTEPDIPSEAVMQRFIAGPPFDDETRLVLYHILNFAPEPNVPSPLQAIITQTRASGMLIKNAIQYCLDPSFSPQSLSNCFKHCASIQDIGCFTHNDSLPTEYYPAPGLRNILILPGKQQESPYHCILSTIRFRLHFSVDHSIGGMLLLKPDTEESIEENIEESIALSEIAKAAQKHLNTLICRTRLLQMMHQCIIIYPIVGRRFSHNLQLFHNNRADPTTFNAFQESVKLWLSCSSTPRPTSDTATNNSNHRYNSAAM